MGTNSCENVPAGRITVSGRLRATIKKHLPTVWDVTRTIVHGRFEVFPPRVTFALAGLHQKIKARFGDRPGFFFEVGANNGLDQSNTAYLERYCGWKGILVEAVPHKFVQCVQNRPNSVVIHAALTPLDYRLPYVEVAYSNLMSISTLSGQDVEAHVRKGADFLSGESNLSGTIFFAPARSAASILTMQKYPTIDLFSLDVEGAELQVLNGIDFTKSRPRFFLIEVRDLKTMTSFMESKGYCIVEQWSFHDYLFADRLTA